MCVYTYIYICMRIYVYVYIYIYVYICVHMYIHVYIYVYVYAYICIYIHIYAYVCTYICTYICTCIYMCICICTFCSISPDVMQVFSHIYAAHILYSYALKYDIFAQKTGEQSIHIAKYACIFCAYFMHIYLKIC